MYCVGVSVDRRGRGDVGCIVGHHMCALSYGFLILYNWWIIFYYRIYNALHRNCIFVFVLRFLGRTLDCNQI